MIAMNARGDALLTYDSCCAMRLRGPPAYLPARRARTRGGHHRAAHVRGLARRADRARRAPRRARQRRGHLGRLRAAARSAARLTRRTAAGPRARRVAAERSPGSSICCRRRWAACSHRCSTACRRSPGCRNGRRCRPARGPPAHALPPALLGLTRLGARAKLSVAVTKVPRATGRAQLALRVGCSAACTVGVEGTLRSAAGGRALRLPGAAIRLDRAATAEVRLALAPLPGRPCAARALARQVDPPLHADRPRDEPRWRSGATATAAASRSFKFAAASR